MLTLSSCCVIRPCFWTYFLLVLSQVGLLCCYNLSFELSHDVVSTFHYNPSFSHIVWPCFPTSSELHLPLSLLFVIVISYCAKRDIVIGQHGQMEVVKEQTYLWQHKKKTGSATWSDNMAWGQSEQLMNMFLVHLYKYIDRSKQGCMSTQGLTTWS